MAKKEFTDIEITLCERKCNFKRVTNETLTEFSKKAEKAYDETVKKFVDDVELFDDKRVSLEKKIALKQKIVDVIESKEEVTDEELDRVISTIEDIEHCETELDIVKTKLMELGENNPTDEYNDIIDKLLAEKVETFLTGITAKEFLKESDPVDSIKARNLEKYYQLAIVGEHESKIRLEMKDDVDNFLQSQKELRRS